jgi:hypothetical protein
MGNVNIRITRRLDGSNGQEETIDLEFCGAPANAPAKSMFHAELAALPMLQAGDPISLDDVAKALDIESTYAIRRRIEFTLRDIGWQKRRVKYGTEFKWFPPDWTMANATLADAEIASAATELEWSNTLCDGERVTHAKAEKACAALGEGWRLPTRMELESILDLTRHEPAIDTDRFPDTQSGAYWTSTPCAWSSDYAWFVNFADGNADSYHRGSYDAFVRAVRSVPAGQ